MWMLDFEYQQYSWSMMYEPNNCLFCMNLKMTIFPDSSLFTKEYCLYSLHCARRSRCSTVFSAVLGVGLSYMLIWILQYINWFCSLLLVATLWVCSIFFLWIMLWKGTDVCEWCLHLWTLVRACQLLKYHWIFAWSKAHLIWSFYSFWFSSFWKTIV